jgi:hypothetical protein
MAIGTDIITEKLRHVRPEVLVQARERGAGVTGGHQVVGEGLELDQPDPSPVFDLHLEATGRP